METNRDEAREALLTASRAEAAPYVEYPETPAWFIPVTALWFAAIVGVWSLWQENRVLFGVCIAVLFLLEAGCITWMQRRHGALPMPGTGTPPPEIARVWRGYFIGCALVALAVALAWWWAGIPAAALTAFVTIAGGLVWYERAYAAAAAAVRARLA